MLNFGSASSCVSVINYIATSQSTGVMFNTTFLVTDEVIQVQAMPKFVHQDCVKLIGFGEATKYNCALKPHSILNKDSVTTFLSTTQSTCLKWKIKKKMFKEVNETVKNSWCDQLNEAVKKLWQNFLCGNVCVYP